MKGRRWSRAKRSARGLFLPFLWLFLTVPRQRVLRGSAEGTGISRIFFPGDPSWLFLFFLLLFFSSVHRTWALVRPPIHL